MKPYSLLLLSLTLLFIAQAQRGGGGRRSSRSSFSSFRRRRSYNSATGETDEYWYVPVGAFVGIFTLVSLLSIKWEKQRGKLRKDLKLELFREFQGKCECNPCSLDLTAMGAARDWFMSQKWSIRFSTHDNSYHDNCRLSLKDLTPRSQFSYDLKFTMTDSVGSSQCQGILIHQHDYFGFMFDKVYNDRQKAGQTGRFDLLLYEGIQQGDKFVGRWWYRGHEHRGRYSGSWAMYY